MKNKKIIRSQFLLSGYIVFWSTIIALNNIFFLYFSPFLAMIIGLGFFISFIENKKIINKIQTWLVSSLAIGSLTYAFTKLYCDLFEYIMPPQGKVAHRTYCEILVPKDFLRIFLGFSGFLIFLIIASSKRKEVGENNDVEINTKRVNAFFYIILFLIFVIPVINELVKILFE